MTRRTQKSSRQRKRQSTRKRGGTYGKRGKWIYKWFCIIRNGIEQCIRGHKKNNNDDKYYDQDGFLITNEYVSKNNKITNSIVK